jgi:hypothetical protein
MWPASHRGGSGSVPGSSMKGLCWTVALEHVLSHLPVVIQPVRVFIIGEAGTNKARLRPQDQRKMNHAPPPPPPSRTDNSCYYHPKLSF